MICTRNLKLFSYPQFTHKLPATLQDSLQKSHNWKSIQVFINHRISRITIIYTWAFKLLPTGVPVSSAQCLTSYPSYHWVHWVVLSSLKSSHAVPAANICTICCVLYNLPIFLSGYSLHTTEAFLTPHIQFKSSPQIYSPIESLSILALTTIYNWMLSASSFNACLPN